MAVENWFEMSERVADPKFLLRKKAESELEKRFPDIFKSRYGLVTYTLTQG
jgi:kynurenine 3-monooxygenase